MRSIPAAEATSVTVANEAGMGPSMRASSALGSPVLTIESLSVGYPTPSGEQFAVRDLSLTVAPGECLGVAGASGAGKSQAFLAVMGLTPAAARVSGRMRLGEVELAGLPPRALSRLRGARMAMVFQDHSTSLTPHLTIGDQIAEAIVRHQRAPRRAARARALELLERVQMSDPSRRLHQYPHELSGGMRQRAMLAIALSCSPSLLIADEPTTALDVTVQAQILALLAELKREQRLAIVLITHDFGVIAGLADRVAVMHGGRKVEEGEVARIFAAPEHPHTRALLAAARGELPHGAVARDAAAREVAGPGGGARSTREPPLPHAAGAVALSVSQLTVEYPLRERRSSPRVARAWTRLLPRIVARAGTPARRLRAVDGVRFDLRTGEALGIVGESGCGKSTLVRAVLRLLPSSAGTVVWAGRPLEALAREELRVLRRELQIVFQDALGSLDPHLTAGEIVAEPLAIHRPDLSRAERASAAAEMLARVGLAPDAACRLPHELSGGQCQRVGIARAMILAPKLLVCDEPVSALDASLREEIVGLIDALRRERGTAILFVSHDLDVVRRLCERVLVLYLGRTMELGPAGRLHDRPLHPYTRALLAAVPVPEPEIQAERLRRMAQDARQPKPHLDGRPGTRSEPSVAGRSSGDSPSPTAPPSGCVFRTRCPYAVALCAVEAPGWEPVGDERWVACHRWRDADLA